MGSTPMESEVNNIGQRKKLNYNTVSMKVSVDPIQNSGADLTLSGLSSLKQK